MICNKNKGWCVKKYKKIKHTPIFKVVCFGIVDIL